LAEAFARAGAGLLPFLGLRFSVTTRFGEANPGDRLSRFGLGLLLGLPVLGLVNLGLAALSNREDGLARPASSGSH
jgi:hypothetical protein